MQDDDGVIVALQKGQFAPLLDCIDLPNEISVKQFNTWKIAFEEWHIEVGFYKCLAVFVREFRAWRRTRTGPLPQRFFKRLTVVVGDKFGPYLGYRDTQLYLNEVLKRPIIESSWTLDLFYEDLAN